MTDNGFGMTGSGFSTNYAVRLTFFGTQPRIIYNGARQSNPNQNQQVWLAYSTTGAGRNLDSHEYAGQWEARRTDRQLRHRSAV